MIKLIFTIIFSTITGVVLPQTNVYHTFPDSNAVWGLSSSCIDPGCGDYAHVKDFYDGDTLIDGNKYWKVKEYIQPITTNSCCFPVGNSGNGFLREDSIARKVYWRAAGMESDSLLYDFNLNIGDTIRGFLTLSSCCTLTIQSIDSVLVGTTYRKRYNLDTSGVFQSDTLSIIEGVGSTRGLTNLYWGYFQLGTKLECFSVDDHIVYYSSDNSDSIPCGTLNAISDYFSENKQFEIGVYPNPCHDQLNFETQISITGASQVYIYNEQGQAVLQQTIQSPAETINTSALKPGIYLLKIINSQYSESHRFIKLN